MVAAELLVDGVDENKQQKAVLSLISVLTFVVRADLDVLGGDSHMS